MKKIPQEWFQDVFLCFKTRNPFRIGQNKCITRPPTQKSSFSRYGNAGGVADAHLGRPRRPLEVPVSPDGLICCLRRFLADGTIQRPSATPKWAVPDAAQICWFPAKIVFFITSSLELRFTHRFRLRARNSTLYHVIFKYLHFKSINIPQKHI